VKTKKDRPTHKLFPRAAKQAYRKDLAVYIGVAVFAGMLVLIGLSNCDNPFHTIPFLFAVSDVETPPGCDGGWLTWAAVAAKAVLLVPLAVLVWSAIRDTFWSWVYRIFANNHTVVCGLGWQGRAFVVNCAPLPGKVIAVEINADTAVELFCRDHQVHLVRGNADQTSALRSCAIHKAKRVYICTGDQDENLRIASCIRAFVDEHRTAVIEPLEMDVSLGADLSDGANSDKLFTGLLSSTRRCHVGFYDPEKRMARVFYYHHPVYQWAAERRLAAADDVRVHLVFLGFSRLVGELILQYARIWPCANQRSPLFSIICNDRTRIDSFLRRHPILKVRADKVDAIPVEYQGIVARDLPGHVDVYCRDRQNKELLDIELMQALQDISPVTAVVCSVDDTETSLQRAAQCRQLSQRHQVWSVPVLAEMEKRQGTEAMLAISEQQSDPAQQIIPFGSPVQYCDTQLLAYMDELASEIHGDYRNKFAVVEEDGSRMPGDKSWNFLDYHLRQSNFRAADHVLPKLFSAGYHWRGIRPDISSRSSLLYATVNLSQLEHKSWMAEKLIAGYRPGERDDVGLFHPDLKSWGTLEARDKDKDKAQIAVVQKVLRSVGDSTRSPVPTAAAVTRIALIGHNAITRQQANYVAAQMQALLETLCLGDTKNWVWFDFITPLAPGSDCALVSGVLNRFQSAIWQNGSVDSQRPVAGYRLVIPKALPHDTVDGDFRPVWEQGVDWLENKRSFGAVDFEKEIQRETAQRQSSTKGSKPIDSSEIREKVENTAWQWFAHEIKAERARLLERAPDVRFIPLPADDPEERHARAYQRASEYMLLHADRLVAVLDPARDTDQPFPGGTADTVSQWRKMMAGNDKKPQSLTLINPPLAGV
jgi:hypothetical protein